MVVAAGAEGRDTIRLSLVLFDSQAQASCFTRTVRWSVLVFNYFLIVR